MIESDRPAFSAALRGTFVMYEKQASIDIVDLWWAVLKPYEINKVLRAFNIHIADPEAGMFAPKPANIIKHIIGTKSDNAMLAWGKVTTAIRHGGSKSVCFDDPAINQTILDMGGWPALCMTETDKLQFKAKSFESRYKQYVANPPQNPPTHLIGREEKSNNQFGFTSDEPVMIGDKQQARLNYSKAPKADYAVLPLVNGGAE